MPEAHCVMCCYRKEAGNQLTGQLITAARVGEGEEVFDVIPIELKGEF
jgi:hypothetical protein